MLAIVYSHFRVSGGPLLILAPLLAPHDVTHQPLIRRSTDLAYACVGEWPYFVLLLHAGTRHSSASGFPRKKSTFNGTRHTRTHQSMVHFNWET